MKKDKSSTKAILIKNIFTYFKAIFLVITVLLILACSYRSLTFLPVVIANILIGIIQQLRAQKILDRLTLIAEAKYHILRNGSEICVAGFLICLYGFSSLFVIDYVSYQCVMLAVVFAIAQESLMRNLTLFFERCKATRI